jgi:V8-like Glu-specific endopeptidase
MESFEKYYIKLGVKIIAILAFFLLVAKPIYAAKISTDTLDKLNKRIVAIGIKRYVLIDEQGKQVNMNATGNGIQIRLVLGAGVLVKNYLDKKVRNILVTAKHVVFTNNGKGPVIPDLYIWGNKKDGGEFEYLYKLFQKQWPNVKWVKHSDPKVDVTISIIGFSDEDLIDFVPLKEFKEISNLDEGEDVYYLGFPNRLGADFGSNPVLRKGIVALNEKGKKFFYMDAVITKGNSGGPVFKSENDNSELLGIVTDFEPQWTEKGYFHSGLGRVYSSDCINDILKSAEFKKTY